MEKFLNTPLHYGRKSMIDIENMKYIVEQEIKKRHLESLYYVLFVEQSNQQWSIQSKDRKNTVLFLPPLG